MKYYLYCRKSTESEDRQVLSLDSQEQELREMADKYGLEIDKVYRENMSAKNPGRPIFEQMLLDLEKSGGRNLLAWKNNRLARNSYDGGKLQWFMEGGLINEIRTFEKTYTNNSNDKFMMTLDFGVAKKYVDDLSVNVKRGNRAKLLKGEWPNYAPTGYVNDKVNKTVLVDYDRAHFVKKAFEMYVTGNFSFKQISEELYKEGFRTRGGNKIYRHQIYKIIKNPFYCGIMERDGKFYPGSYDPIISKELFERTKEVQNLKSRPRPKNKFFTYRGFLKCNSCGCVLTASEKKGHDYYYCTNGKGICNEHKSYLRSENISDFVSDLFAGINLDEEMVEILYESAKQKVNNGNNGQEELIINAQKQL